MPLNEIRVDVKLNFVEQPVEILEREFKKLKRSRIAIIKNLLPAMLAQVGNQGNVGNQNGNVVNENVQENVRNVIVNGNRVVLTRWIEKMEYVQDMSGCSVDQKVKYIVGSFVGKALTWWNSQIRMLSREVAVSMSWNDFKFMMIEEFCPSHEMQKFESELWNYATVGADHAAYTDRLHELASLVTHLVTLKSRMIEMYVYGLAAQICGMWQQQSQRLYRRMYKFLDKNGRDDNKRTRTGNAFTTTTNPVGRENTGMDWLSNYKAEIICHEKVVRIPLLDGKEIEFWIELTPGAMPVAKSPYLLAPSELEEFSGQLKEL
ncbi:putative reverse transcriptase domain-containing protein [Tanacetum coccineum]|uniref:Reverse transcriptase domain-containing protein n=1 Tax=Tanacetum coccineum TaxID=301880 RepID=A0ABQ5EPJ2_9ASTR